MGLVDGAAPVEERARDLPVWVRDWGERARSDLEPFTERWASMPGFEEWVETKQVRKKPARRSILIKGEQDH
jgi:uncharacterized protein (DUF2342 family)